jgi:hypothetical protein
MYYVGAKHEGDSRSRSPTIFCPHASPCQGLHQHTYYAEECQLLILNRRPRNSNVETIEKDLLERSLKAASRDTTQVEYKKIQHASKLLKMLEVDKVRKASLECDRIFTTLTKLMEQGL